MHGSVDTSVFVRFLGKDKRRAAAIEGFPEKYAVIGLDRAGNPI